MTSVVTKSIHTVVGGKNIHRFVIEGSDGFQVTCIEYGATIISVMAPNASGTCQEVSLCELDEKGLPASGPYYGCSVGRIANRVTGGKFTLNEVQYTLAVNNGPNHLHGGVTSLDKRIWESEIVATPHGKGVKFALHSPDGDEGYPGNLALSVTYAVEETALRIYYDAICDMDTPLSLTNHTYWNLSGDFQSSITTHQLHLNCDKYIPLTDTSVPRGNIADVADTVFDFRESRSLLQALKNFEEAGYFGVDNYFIAASSDAPVAILKDTSGRVLTVRTSQPGLQVYTANYLPQEERHHPYRQHYGICLETHGYPDAVNHSNFPSIVQRANERYCHYTEYIFTVEQV